MTGHSHEILMRICGQSACKVWRNKANIFVFHWRENPTFLVLFVMSQFLSTLPLKLAKAMTSVASPEVFKRNAPMTEPTDSELTHPSRLSVWWTPVSPAVWLNIWLTVGSLWFQLCYYHFGADSSSLSNPKSTLPPKDPGFSPAFWRGWGVEAAKPGCCCQGTKLSLHWHNSNLVRIFL